MCWEGFEGCMAPWQTFCWTLLCEWIRPVCVKNWLREEQRSANWTWSKDQFLRSACLILSIKPWNCERSTSDQLTLLAIRQLSFSISSVAYQSLGTPIKIILTILWILDSESLKYIVREDNELTLFLTLADLYPVIQTDSHPLLSCVGATCTVRQAGKVLFPSVLQIKKSWPQKGGIT